MVDHYHSVRTFIRREFLKQEVEINSLEITRSAIRSIVNGFEERGWVVEPVRDERSRHTKHRIIAPGGGLILSMIGGKVYRHPITTEQICRRKHLTKRMLNFVNVPTASGADFTPQERAVATAFFEVMPKPIVVKPTDSGGSYGVTVGVSTLSEFEKAWEHALADGRSGSNVLIEEFLKGVELRAFVIGDDVVSVLARVQPFVVGDGHSSIERLLEQLHQSREVHYRAHRMPVLVKWDFLAQFGMNAKSVPQEGEIVLLSPFSLPTEGAFTIELSSVVDEGIKRLAVEAKNSIPSLEIAGVDLLVEDVRTPGTAKVMEVNTSASVDMHRYPTHGDPKAIDQRIVEYFHHKYTQLVVG